MSRQEPADVAGLELEASLLGDAFPPGDEITAQVLLFNFGDDPVTVNARLALVGSTRAAGEVVFEINGPGGEVPFLARVRIGEPGRDDFASVQPWNCVGRRYELLEYFALDEPGDYALTAVYTSRPGENQVDAWIGTLRSEPVRFRIEDSAA